jgi:hypothetical protein
MYLWAYESPGFGGKFGAVHGLEGDFAGIAATGCISGWWISKAMSCCTLVLHTNRYSVPLDWIGRRAEVCETIDNSIDPQHPKPAAAKVSKTV